MKFSFPPQTGHAMFFKAGQESSAAVTSARCTYSGLSVIQEGLLVSEWPDDECYSHMYIQLVFTIFKMPPKTAIKEQ